jgi:hypothetical protein
MGPGPAQLPGILPGVHWIIVAAGLAGLSHKRERVSEPALIDVAAAVGLVALG